MAIGNERKLLGDSLVLGDGSSLWNAEKAILWLPSMLRGVPQVPGRYGMAGGGGGFIRRLDSGCSSA